MKKVAGVFFLIALFLFTLNPVRVAGTEPDDGGEGRGVPDSVRVLVESQPEKAVSILQQMMKSVEPEDDPAFSSAIYSLSGDAFYYLNDLERSLQHYHRAAEINVMSGREKTREQSYILGNIGYIYDLKEQHLIALDFYNAALTIARELNEKAEIATNLANIGKILTLQGNYRDALSNMEEALAIDRENGDESVIATDLNTIGRIYEAWGQFDKAAEYLKQALEIDLRLNQQEKVAIRYSGLGLVYKAWGKYDLALEYFEKALAIDKALKNEEKVALRQANIGSTYLAMGQADKAMIFLKLGLDYFEKHGMTSFAATTLTDMGRYYMAREDYAQAEEALRRSIELSTPGRMNRSIMNSLEQLAYLYHQTGRHEKAFEALTSYMGIKDSLFDKESQEIISEFQVRYELEKKERENEALRFEKVLEQKRHQSTRLSLIVVALFLVTAFLALAVRFKINQNRRLITEKENEALRADLERRNKELTYNALCIIKNNETMTRMVEAVDQVISSQKGGEQLKGIILQLQKMEQDKNWDEFEVRFIQTHQDFYDKLQARFPDLTPNERKLCAFLRLNMSTKDIAAITHQSINSINVARTRLRKKLGIDGSDENLVGFLHAL
jgi:tetratricopeptide (TPR) repeat protein